MSPEQTSLLLSLAQLGVAFAGFAAIVVLFGRGDSGRWRDRERANRFHGMVVHSLVAVFFCLLPLLLDAFTSDPSSIWLIASALLGIEIVAHATGVILMPSTMRIRTRAAMSLGYAVAAVQFMNAAGIGFDRAFEAFIVGVVWHVFMSGVLFLMLTWVPHTDVDAA